MSVLARPARTGLAVLTFAASVLAGGARPSLAEDPAHGQPSRLSITHGVASGDVSATSAVIWARASGPARMQVEYDTDRGFGQAKTGPTASAVEARDFTALVALTGLTPNTTYYYRVSFAEADGGRSEGVTGTFRTAPERSTTRAVSFV